MTTVDQFLKALAMVESSDNPEAWGDGGRAMGRWQVHPDRLWSEMHSALITPLLGETWDHLVERVLTALYSATSKNRSVYEIAMYWHVGHWVIPSNSDWAWDVPYAQRFTEALEKVKEVA